MQTKILNLTKKLIEIESTNANYEKTVEIFNMVEKELSGFTYATFESDNSYSLLAGNRGINNLKYKIILNAHLDVVAGDRSEFTPLEKEGKLFGRGAYDMKGAAAVMILLFKEIAGTVDYPLGLQITTDEEMGGEDGTGYQIKNGVRADFAITGEGTNFNIVYESKVRMLLKLTAKGKASHGAYPWLGENAIFKMQQAISKIHEAYPMPKSECDETTLNITSISTDNKTDNKTPDHCEALIDARVIHEEKDSILSSIRKIVAEEISVEVIQGSDGHQANPNNEYIKKLLNSSRDVLSHEVKLKRAHGTSDARYFTSSGGEGVEFGPVGGNHHADGEWVDIKSLVDYYSILKNFLIS